jgi:uncharacterized protein with PQ loop repeat
MLLFISAFFLGGFLSSFDIISHAIFFEHWNQQDFSMVYLFSGGFGIILFSIYTILHKRVSYKDYVFRRSGTHVSDQFTGFAYFLEVQTKASSTRTDKTHFPFCRIWLCYGYCGGMYGSLFIHAKLQLPNYDSDCYGIYGSRVYIAISDQSGSQKKPDLQS